MVKWTLLSIVALRIFVFVLLDQHTYWTFDEPWNTETAKQVLVEKQFRRTKDSFTPISIANVWLGEEMAHVFPRIDKLSSYRVAGVVLNQASVPLSYLLALELGATTTPALVFTTFLAFEPNVLAHTLLASNVDGYILTWFLLLALMALRWARKPTPLHLALFGLTLGLAQGVKLTSAYAVPLCLAWMIFVTWRKKHKKPYVTLPLFLLYSWLGLCFIYAFNKLGTPLNQITFTSQQFQNIAQRLPWLSAPVPVDYLQGLDMCLKTDTTPRPVYIRNTFLLHGVWYYFLYALLLKMPLPILVSSVAGWLTAARRKILRLPHGFLVLFIIVMMIYFSFFFNAQIGIRYLFPIYPFLMAGILWIPWKKISLALATVWMIFTFGYNWPNFIGYFNELVWTKHHRWWHLGDSNLTWNQEWKDWPLFISQNHLSNEQIGPATFPVGMPFYEDAITVSGVLSNRQQLEVLRDHFSPYDSFWGTKLKYLLSPADFLAQFPPKIFPPSSKPIRPCEKYGWVSETGQPALEGGPSALGVGEHLIQTRFNIDKRGPVLFQLASKNASSMEIEGQPVLDVPDPTPRVALTTLLMKEGSYSVKLKYSKQWPDGFVSVRANALRIDEAAVLKSTAPPVIFCHPD